MNPERWQAVGELFDKALALPAGERTACIDRDGGSDVELRREVLSLLASHKATPGGFVQEKIKSAVVAFHETEQAAQPPRVGPYRLIRELGSGGMGKVFLAERDDGHYKADVAIKLVRPGMDTDFVLARFRRERQTLARLQHPNIARLLDGGTTESGLPYIVMEYIDGAPITNYCKTRKLGLAARVRLFLDVCLVVDYAHRNFVVHRDLKPGNILVDSQGAPKLVDFGICRLLTADPCAGLSDSDTAPGLMTPGYASPEQIRGEAVMPLSDIYSLGVVLYELLTGKTLHRFAKLSVQEIARAVAEREIPLASTSVQHRRLARLLSGDLDHILKRALEIRPEQRYESAEHFADDLRRYLSHEPVHARPQTVRYRTYKFLRRYSKEVAGVCAVFLALIVGLTASLREAHIADARLAQLRGLASGLVFQVHDAVRDLPGATHARQLIVQTAITYLDSSAAAAKGNPQAERELASAYRKLGDVQGNVVGANLGNPSGALASYQKALALIEDITRRKPSDIAAQTERLLVYNRIGAIQAHTGKMSDAIQTLQNAIHLSTPLLASADNSFRTGLADLYVESSDEKRNMGDWQGSLRDASEALRFCQQIQASGRASSAMLQSLAAANAGVGMGDAKLGRLRDALGHFREGAAEMEQLVTSDPQNTSLRRDLMLAYGHIGDVLGNPSLENLGDRAGALQAYRRAAEIGKALHEADSANEQAGADYGIVLSRVATVMDDGDLKAKAAAERESLRVLREVTRISSDDLSLQLYCAFVNQQLGDTLRMSGDLAAAERAYSEAASIAESGRKSGQISFVTIFVLSNRKLAQNSVARGRRGEALEFARRAFEASTNLPRGSESSFLSPRGLDAMGLTFAALTNGPLRRPDDRQQAICWLRKSLDAWHQVQREPDFAAPHQREMGEVESALANLEHR